MSAQIEEKGATDFWVRFDARPDMSSFQAIQDRDERRIALYEALTSAAESSQKEVRAELDADGVEYQAFWATNAIKVASGDEALVTALAAERGVEGIYPSFEVEIPDLEEAKPVMAPAAVEWGVGDINADDVWSTWGVHGEGVVVGSIDTGAQYDHPALVEQYRGNNGDGTFTHDYNWFDAAGTSPDQPSDGNGHGTHVTGTMVGDDGGENQIGVAPGATWIAANGCCPSDAALVNSGQWMLAPTKLDGTSPDPTKAPDIINNSWGTTAPSNEPFMEEIIEDWHTAGIFGVFANGNSGSLGCNSSGAPGSRIVAYSVGNYTSSHALAGSSGRGYGQDGEIKPNISAPGTAVRSSVPGGGYQSYTGTSMASPHVAGAVALLWSGNPALKGDVDLTRTVLDGTAVNTEFSTCGGTLEDNNGFGEGRLDVLAALNEFPPGDTGTLNGVVTDTATGDPISGATIQVDGAFNRTLTTNAAGEYSALLVSGDYALTATKFGYVTETANATVPVNAAVTVDFALDAAPSATVSGTVTDGSGHGWPLYTKVSAGGTGVHTYTDPATGEYTLDLPTGATYSLEFQAQYPGYVTTTSDVTVDGALTHDEQIVVDAETCTAPGYSYVVQGVTESFDSTELPAGWEVVDHAGTGEVWQFTNPGARDNMTGGEGNFAILDSDEYGSGGSQDTSLVTPTIDATALTAPAVGFKQDWRALGDDLADVDVSIDGGATWTTVLSQDASVRGPNEQFIQLPMAAGEADVKVRFHGHLMEYDWWWEVDDVFVGNRSCDPTIAGGYVVGTVSSANDASGVVGATVTSVEAPEETGTTVATPDDANLGDGFYWIFSTLTGAHDFEATARNFESKTQSVDVAADDAVRADFVLGSGFVEITPESIETSVVLGDSATETLTLTNTGFGAAEVTLSEVGGDFEILRADGTKDLMSEMRDAEGAPLQEIEAEVSFAQHATGKAAQGDPVANRGISEAPWTDLAQLGSNNMDGRSVNLDGTWYLIGGGSGSASYDTVQRYDAAAMTWTPVASLPSPRNAVTAGNVNGQIVVSGGWVASGTTAETLVYDEGADSWTAVADNPVAVSAAGQAVVDGKLYSVGGCSTSACTPMSNAVTAYDPASDTWETLANYPAAVAFASCAGLNGEVFCTGGNGGAGGTADSYVYSPDSNSWTAIADAPADTWASQYAGANGMFIVNGGVQGGAVSNATFAYDTAAQAWVELPNSNTAVYRGAGACGFGKFGGSSGGFSATPDTEHLPGFEDCGAAGADVTWLSLSATEFTIAPDQSVTVEVTTDGAVAQPGTYTAGIRVSTNTPQSFDTIPVTMVVTPPRTWGKLLGNVAGTDCDGVNAPIDGATVDITPTRTSHPGWVLATNEEGNYAVWVNTEVTRGGVQIIAAKDGFRPQVKSANPQRGGERVVDFTLQKVGC